MTKTIMYRIDIFNRLPDGNRGTKVSSSWYPTKAEAQTARTTLILLRQYNGFVPQDSLAKELRKSKPAKYTFGRRNLIIGDVVEEN